MLCTMLGIAFDNQIYNIFCTFNKKSLVTSFHSNHYVFSLNYILVANKDLFFSLQ